MSWRQRYRQFSAEAMTLWAKALSWSTPISKKGIPLTSIVTIITSAIHKITASHLIFSLIYPLKCFICCPHVQLQLQQSVSNPFFRLYKIQTFWKFSLAGRDAQQYRSGIKWYENARIPVRTADCNYNSLYPIPFFVCIKSLSPTLSNFLRSRFTFTDSVFSST